MKVICLGDSITGQSQLHLYLKWSHILDLMFEAKYGPGKVMVQNHGMGGDTTQGVLNRLDSGVIAEKPGMVVLLIGGNDAAQPGFDPAQTMANYSLILERLQQAGAKVLCLQYAMLVDDANPGAAWVTLDDNNELIAQVAAQHGCPVLAMQPLMLAALKDHPVGELVAEDDRVHLHPRGELIFASAVFHKIEELEWVGKR